MSTDPLLPLPADYADWLGSLKLRIQGARQRALLSANAEQICLYHDLGRDILERQSREGWGAKVINQLSADLRAAFPGMKGLSSRNLHYMRLFAELCPTRQFVQQTAAQIPARPIMQQSAAQITPIGQQTADLLPWFHIVTLLTKLADPTLREWYARQAIEHSWPRDTLSVQIKNQLHLRQGQAITNFEQRLAPPQAGLATEILKDPYHFDFLGLGDEAHERDIENALIRHITRFLLELGAGFAFVGRQFQLIVGGDEFFIDLLFYHTRLKCYVVVELKAQAFKPEHAGQLNFYLSAVDSQVKAPDDKPTIGLLLCKTQIIRRYVQELRGVSNYYSRSKNWRYVGNHLHWLCKDSLVKTLASKSRTQRTQTYSRVKMGDGIGIEVENKVIALLSPKAWKRYKTNDPDRKPQASIPVFQS